MDSLSTTDPSFDISKAQVTEPDVAALIERHFGLMRSQSPEEACHVMSARALSESGTQVYVLRYERKALAIGALKTIDEGVELKSMHTAAEARGRGCARALLRALLKAAMAQGFANVFLETGAGPEHLAARTLYASEGFKECPAFGSYTAHPLSVYMTRNI